MALVSQQPLVPLTLKYYGKVVAVIEHKRGEHAIALPAQRHQPHLFVYLSREFALYRLVPHVTGPLQTVLAPVRQESRVRNLRACTERRRIDRCNVKWKSRSRHRRLRSNSDIEW